MTNNLSENKDKKKPGKGLIIGCICFVIVLIVMVLAIKPSSSSSTIDLNKYLVYETSGTDGNGLCAISVDWNAIESEFGEKLSYTNKANEIYGNLLESMDIMEFIKNRVELSIENNYYLHNEDTVKFSWNVYEDELSPFINCSIKYSNGEYKVSGLDEANTIDFFNNFSKPYVTFSGRNGNAKAVLNCNTEEDFEIYRDDNIIVVYKCNSTDPEIQVIKDNQKLCSLFYCFDKSEGLSNGDTVLLKLHGVDSLFDYGYAPAEDNLTFTVENRPEILTSIDDINVDKVIKYVNKLLPESNNEESESYSNLQIHSVYYVKAKDTTVTDYPIYLVADYSYDYNYDTSFYNSKTVQNQFVELANIYYENDELMVDTQYISNYSSWGIQSIEYYIEKLSASYDIEKLY